MYRVRIALSERSDGGKWTSLLSLTRTDNPVYLYSTGSGVDM